eukprot:CAMPEP_0174362206 /NCGR_PEP_ID=MMETSP0811_2-20130205/63212_1 /TAXON_ID=73025 ORGANISM="Eutreptiella gymnastica-like, Strain CCMP1594" /NCGR_SAMPLE_ID=MMETSP0811_2 /ASSEMBLY_ACC=CAM_ASM_000667 /LENGTH=59 /DNA_ID=CAMNT_0015499657 /DNA_START=1146 /DNA_END=1321 /DNA_ORIENTATION=-
MPLVQRALGLGTAGVGHWGGAGMWGTPLPPLPETPAPASPTCLSHAALSLCLCGRWEGG